MDAACFDMDGVLVNSEDYWIELEREEILPTAVPDQEVPVEEVTGIFYEEQYDVLDETYDLAVDYEAFVSLYEGAADEIYGEQVELTPGVRALLTELREAGVPVAMVTASPPEWYEIVLERFDLGDLFDTVVSAADLDGPGKPEPTIYERAAAELGVDPATALAVEDSHHGTTAAHRAGMTVVSFGVGAAEGATENADLVAETPAEMVEIVRSNVLASE
ncbi:HAD family phosphatase [Halomicrobium sp. LC1Hm]|uniref:HAD family hydrolase n=1 Tax=Halomicrobium sp. LC1Hm TaxID=2610902 RepID=UPI0012985083|nr:HAD family phosphatase [Halomicrobium sp. LC1Hm]QGA84197.1 HAD superfamily hydrolase [Halomicrobium sp. LC1Hm]